MNTTELKKAKAAYPKADEKQKELLESIFGKKPFQPVVKNGAALPFEKAYPIFMKKKFTDEINLSLQKRKKADLNTLDKLLIMAEVHRGDWIADYDDEDQRKYWGWFEKTASGWVFNASYCEYTLTYSTVGPRFAQETPEKARQFAEQFMDMHIIVLTNK